MPTVAHQESELAPGVGAVEPRVVGLGRVLLVLLALFGLALFGVLAMLLPG